MMIYKILRADEWTAIKVLGKTAGAPVDLADGFIHFSTATQLPGTLAKHFGNETDLILLACDAKALSDSLRWEPARDGDLFPHLYRPLLLADICWTRPVGLTADGHETGPLQ